jgi:hypothetical protein
MKKTQTDLLQGTLDLLVLKTLQAGPTHGWDIAQRIQAGFAGGVAGGSGVVISGAAPAGSAGLDRFGVGGVGEQPEGEVLQSGWRRRTTGRRSITN